MKTLLNGNESIELGVDDMLRAEYWPAGPGQIACLNLFRPSARWEAKLWEVQPNAQSIYTTSASADFMYHHWMRGDIFCIAGGRRFFLVGRDSGQIMVDEKLEFTHKKSLDILEILENTHGDKLLVLSTKIGWLISAPMLTTKPINVAGLATAVHRYGNGFEIRYLDTCDVDLPAESLVI